MQFEPFTEETMAPLPPGREYLAVAPELRAKKRQLAWCVAKFLNDWFEREGTPFEAYEYTNETGRLTSVGVSDVGSHQFATIRVTDALELILDGLRGYPAKMRKVAKWLDEGELRFQGQRVRVVYAQPQVVPAPRPAHCTPPAVPKQLRVAALVRDVARAVKMAEVLDAIEAELDRHGLKGKLRAAVRASVLRGG